jgi:hypothetical protein
MPGPIAAKPIARAAARTEAAETNGSMMILFPFVLDELLRILRFSILDFRFKRASKI